MSDEPIVVKISIRRGKEKPYCAQQTITDRFHSKMGEFKTKEAAMAYFSEAWDKSQRKKQPKLKLVKE